MRWLCLAIALCLIGGLPACVSGVEPVLGSAQAFSNNGVSSQPALTGVSAANDGFADSSTSGRQIAEVTAPPLPSPRPAYVAIVNDAAVSEPASAAEPDLGQPVELASLAQQAPASGEQESAIAVAVPVQAAVIKKPASLYEFLLMRKQQREAQLQANAQPNTQPGVVSTIPASIIPVPTPAAYASEKAAVAALDNASVASLQSQNVAGGDNEAEQQTASQANALPGVTSGDALFGIGHEDGDEEEATNQMQVASVGSFGRLSPNGLRTQTEKVEVGCFEPALVALIKVVERHYNRQVVVTSGFRSASGNRRAGGARKSMHVLCKAADIQVEGVSKWDMAKYLRSIPGRGGIGTYCRTDSVHVDIGFARDWHHPCRRSKKNKRRA